MLFFFPCSVTIPRKEENGESNIAAMIDGLGLSVSSCNDGAEVINGANDAKNKAVVAAPILLPHKTNRR
jgi:hypothetical protein